ncbi:MAG: hypothetical protein OXN25_08190 [Candidatus Poribacteria bacterium]|nr:hypothetical protein [Candidatus Poribacteria bacterium]
MNGLSFFSNAEIWKRLSVSATIAILFFFLILPTSAQDESQSGPADEDKALSEMEQSDFLTSGLYGGGLTFIDGDTYVQLQLQPDIPLGKIGIGLDLILLYNPYAEGTEPQILAEDGESWDSPSTWLRLIRYVRYGQPYAPFYVRFGELDYLTIGHGSIMSGYSNYDRRGVRLNLRGAKNRSGVETMLNDIGNPSIFGGRVFLRPFQREENNNFLTRFELGATYLTDINPNLQEAGEEPLSAIGLDVGFPIFETSTFRLDLYDDIAFLNTLSDTVESESETTAVEESSATNLAWGNAVGVGFAFTQAIFKIEYRVFGDGYIPSVFDYTYESAKSLSPEPDVPQFLGLETMTEPRRGFFSQLIWQPLPQIHFLGTLEDYTNIEPKLYMGTTVSKLVPRLSLRAFYTKRDIGAGGETNFFGDLFDLDEKSAFSVEARYTVFPPVETIVLREYTFRRVETAEGVSQFEPIHKTSFMVGVSTDF